MQKNRLWITRGDGELVLARTHSNWLMEKVETSKQKNLLWIRRGDGELVLARTHSTWLMTVVMFYGPQ